jgi:hypothetical protein
MLDQPSKSANQYRLQLFLRVTLHPPFLVGEKEDKEVNVRTQPVFIERDNDA